MGLIGPHVFQKLAHIRDIDIGRDEAFANAVNRAYSDLASEESNFVNLSKQFVGDKADFVGETGTLEPFARTEAPALLKGNEDALEALFSGTQRNDEVSVPIHADGGAYLVFHYSKSIDPVPLTIEQATPAIKEALSATKSNRAVNDAASAALAKLNEAIKAGKPFDEAAKEQKLKVETLPNFSESEPPADLADAALIVQAVKGLGEKQISGVTERTGGEGYLLVYVDKIEIYKDDQAEAKKKTLTATIKNETDRALFTAWFNQRRTESGSRRPDLGTPAP